MDRKIREWMLHEEIGRGGMGVVYRATHRYMSGDWAVKVMRPELAEDEESRERFLSEVTVLSSLQHPGIVRIHAPFEESGQLYLPMEYLMGCSLDAALKNEPGPWDTVRAVAVARAAAEAVGYAHRRSPAVIHRDIKPLNIQLLEDGECKVMDFGLARMLGGKSITATGKAVGTPAYMAPEVLDGRKATARSDVYSLGVVLYRLLAGRLPYDMPEEDSSIQAVFMAVATGIARGLPDVRDFAPAVPPDLAALVMRTLSRDPAVRPADGAELAALLGRVDLGAGGLYGRMKIRPSGTGTGTGMPGPDADSTHLGIDLDLAQRAPVQAGRDIAASSSPASGDSDRSLLGLEIPRPAVSTHALGVSPELAPYAQFGKKEKSRKVLAVSLVCGILVVALAGWYFGYEQPRRQAVADQIQAKKAKAERIAAERAADEAACRSARTEDTEASWNSYLTTHPDGQCETEAREAVERLTFAVQWVRIPGGTFWMGSNDYDASDDEKPVHSVTVSTFEIAKTETTVAQYRKCVEAGVCTAPYTTYPDAFEDFCNWGKPDRANHPVNCLKEGQATVYAKWVGGRLPTEAEWEYAARSAGRNQKYPWGNQPATCEYAVIYDRISASHGCGRNSTWPVCSKTAGNTAQGLCDMAGNVWEWVADWYGSYGSDSVTNPTGPTTASFRVRRGGSFHVPAVDVRAAYRGYSFWGDHATIGFRTARSVP